MEAAPWTIPDGRRAYAVGDIHGRLDLLIGLIDQIERDDAARRLAETSIIFLGDLVDRGPDSAGVVEFLRNYAQSGRACVFLTGNHDEVFALAASGMREAVAALHRMGGRETALSYGITIEEYERGSFEDLAALFTQRVPATHLAFLRSFRDWYQLGDYVFVHAGVRPKQPLRDQQAADLRWIRSSFLDYRDSHGFMVVHGHTITDAPEFCSNRIAIDTGAFRSGKLTALRIAGAPTDGFCRLERPSCNGRWSTPGLFLSGYEAQLLSGRLALDEVARILAVGHDALHLARSPEPVTLARDRIVTIDGAGDPA